MCQHVDVLEQKRNALVALRESLGDLVLLEPMSPLSEELSRHENFYAHKSEMYQEDYCPVCESTWLSIVPVRETTRYWEDTLCDEVQQWRK
jgi:hypothetical protein